MRSLLLVCSTLLQSLVGETFLPPTTGTYNVGFVQHVLNHTTKNDPTAPSGIGKDFLVTFYYPTVSSTNQTRAYIPKQLAGVYEKAFGYPDGSLADETTNLQPRAPISADTSKFPTIVFGPGGAGPPSNSYTALLSDLASPGYTVAAVDHP
jgi:predicted dienelactone hydrolase